MHCIVVHFIKTIVTISYLDKHFQIYSTCISSCIVCVSLITSSFLDIFGSLFSNGGSSFVDPVYLHMVCVCVCVCVSE